MGMRNGDEEWDAPAVLVEGKDVALVLDAGDAADIAVFGGKDLVIEIGRTPSGFRVLGPVVPEEGHHHLAVVGVLPQRRHFGHKREILGARSRFEEDAVAHPHHVALRVRHGRIALAHRRCLVVPQVDGRLVALTCRIRTENHQLKQ